MFWIKVRHDSRDYHYKVESIPASKREEHFKIIASNKTLLITAYGSSLRVYLQGAQFTPNQDEYFPIPQR